MLTASLLLAAALAPADAPTHPPDAGVSDAGELQGEWEVVSVYEGKDDKSAGFKGDRWVIAGETFQAINAGGRPKTPKNALRVDAGCCPFRFDVTYWDDSSSFGMGRRAGDELLLAFARPGHNLPASFEPAETVDVTEAPCASTQTWG
jgi:uncharacterized protein (TIGR03067 family)